MDWIALLGAALKAAFEAFGDAWNKRQATLDEQKLGRAEQASADEAEQVGVADRSRLAVADTVSAERDALASAVSAPDRLRDPSPDSRD